MSGILAVYSLVISVLIASDIRPPPDKNYSLYNGIMHMAAGLSVGLPGLAAGYAIGIVGDVVCGMDWRVTSQTNICRVCAHICANRGSLSAWS
jgi:F0F1-type ATP synthase membrane subunit c/vacuolar-type H+-ATPase subunit K